MSDETRTEDSLGAATSSGSAALLVAAVVGGLVIGLLVDDCGAAPRPRSPCVGIFLGIVVGCVGFWLRVRSALRH